MRLALDEFKRIRPLLWSVRQIGDNVYNTVIGETATRLFWLDFVRLVFAPKFRAQRAIARVDNFDVTQPVLLTDDLRLIVPRDIETVAYYADNAGLGPPKTFVVSRVITANAFLMLGIAALLAIVVYAVLAPDNDRVSRLLI